MKRLIGITAISMLVVLGACREEPEEATAETTTQEVEGVGDQADVSPMNAQTWIDDVTIGHELSPDGSVMTTEGGDDFAPGDTIYLAMEVGDAPPNQSVMVMWFGPGEKNLGEETKQVVSGQKYLNFQTSDTSSWELGDYRAEIWTGDEKVNEQQFQIVEASDAGR